MQSEVRACGRDPIDDIWSIDPVLVKDWTLGFLQWSKNNHSYKSGFYTVLQDDVILTISNRANSVLFTFLPLNFLYKVPKISAVLSFCKLILPVQGFCRS